jgi:hypothetical protein
MACKGKMPVAPVNKAQIAIEEIAFLVMEVGGSVM